MTKLLDEREAALKAAKESGGNYAYQQGFKNGWLARARSERVVSVGELGSLIDAMEVSVAVPTANSSAEWENGYSNGVNVTLDELRDLIAKAGVE